MAGSRWGWLGKKPPESQRWGADNIFRQNCGKTSQETHDFTLAALFLQRFILLRPPSFRPLGVTIHDQILFEVIRLPNEPKHPRAELSITTWIKFSAPATWARATIYMERGNIKVVSPTARGTKNLPTILGNTDQTYNQCCPLVVPTFIPPTHFRILLINMQPKWTWFPLLTHTMREMKEFLGSGMDNFVITRLIIPTPTTHTIMLRDTGAPGAAKMSICSPSATFDDG
ncbi:hypothetical protein B0H10DRAFT_1949387 [Mycena sp. CBHHK59/15]|nr:hypothetical protein B0H10DRAFT_1949387 [Mycena sp. CBHHK59/15]